MVSNVSFCKILKNITNFERGITEALKTWATIECIFIWANGCLYEMQNNFQAYDQVKSKEFHFDSNFFMIRKKLLVSMSDSRKSKYPQALKFVFKLCTTRYSLTSIKRNLVKSYWWSTSTGLNPQTKNLPIGKFFIQSEIFALTVYDLCIVSYASHYFIAPMPTSTDDPKFSPWDWKIVFWDAILKF